MVKYEDGCYGSIKGIALIGKVLAGRCKMHYTRVAVGKGTLPEGVSPKTLEEPPEYVMDAMIASVTNPGRRVSSGRPDQQRQRGEGLLCKVAHPVR